MTLDAAAPRLSTADLRARLAAASGSIGVRRSGPGAAPGLRGDHESDPALQPAGPLVKAAVLVPLVERGVDTTILLTRRTAHLTAHAGQISFPGGRIEPEDPSPAHGALREAEEEIGLPPAQVELIGQLDTYITRTGFEVTPVIGLVSGPLSLKPDPFEVAEVFEVPLAFAIDPRNRERRSREFKGGMREFWAIPFGEYVIWGATAGMLVNLSEVLLRR
ncbi:MAG: CoA pyrophosphatase [Alphaproteobacteria bacterium]|nr:CoA pyrophosphatase [Alphaproteobacteria bacterium]